MYRLVLVERRYYRIQKRSALGAKVPLSMSKTTRVTSYQDNHAEVCLQRCGRTVELDTEKRALVLPWHAAKSDNDSKEMLKVDTSCVRSGIHSKIVLVTRSSCKHTALIHQQLHRHPPSTAGDVRRYRGPPQTLHQLHRRETTCILSTLRKDFRGQ